MKVLMLKNAFRPDGSPAPSILKRAESYDLPNDQAAILIDRGVAVDPMEKPAKATRTKSEKPDDTWTVDDLKAFATEKTIDLGEAKKKDEILAKIAAATPAA